MGIRRELLTAVGIIVALNVILAIASIALFARMGPAIQLILSQNVYSIVAAEEILAGFAECRDQPMDPESRATILSALEHAKSNVTVPEELPVVHTLEHYMDAAFDNDAAARKMVIRSSRALIEINRNAMRDVDRHAQRLGTAGAWIAVLVGFLSFLLSLVIISRARSRLLLPLVNLYEVLEGVRRGDQHRRCRSLPAPLEIQHVMRSVNLLLDQRATSGPPRETSSQACAAGLVALLDRNERGAIILLPDGQIARAGVTALNELAGERGHELRAALTAFAVQTTQSPLFEAIELAEKSGWLCLLRAGEHRIGRIGTIDP